MSIILEGQQYGYRILNCCATCSFSVPEMIAGICNTRCALHKRDVAPYGICDDHIPREVD